MTCFPYIVGMMLRRGGIRASVKSPRVAGLGFFARMKDPVVGDVSLGNVRAPKTPMSFDVTLRGAIYRCEFATRRLAATGSSGETCELEVGEDSGQFFVPVEAAMTLRGASGGAVRLVACRDERRYVYFDGGACLLQRPYGFFGRSVEITGVDEELMPIASVASVAIQSLNVLRSWADM